MKTERVERRRARERKVEWIEWVGRDENMDQ